MSDISNLKLFLVANGEAFLESEAPEMTDADSVQVAATSAEGALRAFDAFNNGQTEEQEIQWGGKTISVVALRDPATGQYV